PDRADLEGRRRGRLGPGARRPGAEHGPSKSAPGQMEQMPAAVINGLSPCHVSLHVHVEAAGRSTPLSFTNQLSLSRFNHWLPRRQAPPEVGRGPAEVPHPIANAPLREAAGVFAAAPAFDTARDMVAPQPPLVALLVRHMLRCEFLPQIGIN